MHSGLLFPYSLSETKQGQVCLDKSAIANCDVAHIKGLFLENHYAKQNVGLATADAEKDSASSASVSNQQRIPMNTYIAYQFKEYL